MFMFVISTPMGKALTNSMASGRARKVFANRGVTEPRRDQDADCRLQFGNQFGREI